MHTDNSDNESCSFRFWFPVKPAKKSKKVRWSNEEKDIIYRRFGRSFTAEQQPKRQEIIKVWEEEPVLKNNRTLPQVCTYINNIVKKKIKVPYANSVENDDGKRYVGSETFQSNSVSSKFSSGKLHDLSAGGNATKKKSQRVRWCDEEKEIIYKWFGKYFLRNDAPRRKEIVIAWENEPLLKHNRTLPQLCTYINNIVTKKVKISTADKDRIERFYI